MTRTKGKKTKAVPAKTQPPAKRVALMVLGMHRSGTSALAGMLNILGCDGPATPMEKTKDNQKGYFESAPLYALHTKLLKSAGSSWDDWLPFNPNWYESARAAEFHESAVACVTKEFSTSRFFVLKDPRICRLLPFWRGVLDSLAIAPRFVLTHRNPLEVIQSLSSRDDLNEGHGMLIWLRHVLDAESETRGKIRCFVNYEQLLESWAEVAAKIQTTLKVTLPRMSVSVATEMDAFLDGSLRHFEKSAKRTIDNPLLSDWVRDAYRILEHWSDQGERKADYAALDAIRAALDSAAPTFARVIQQDRETATAHAAERDRLSEIVKTLTTERQQDQLELAENNTLKERLNRLTDVLSQSQSALEQRSHETEQTHDELRALKSVLADRDRTLIEVQDRLDQKEAKLKQQTAQVDAMNAEIALTTGKLNALERRMDTQTRELVDLSRTLQDSETQLDDALIAQSAQYERAAAAERATAAMRKSTSWKITGPMRRIVRLIRK